MREDVRFFHSTSSKQPFFLDMSGISYCDGSYLIERRDQNVYVFEYIIKGTGTIIQDGKEYTASMGDIYLIHRNTTHKYFSSASDPWNKVFFNVRGELVDSLIKSYKMQDRVVVSGVDAYELFMDAYNLTYSDISLDKIISETAIFIHKIIQKMYESIKNESHHSDEALTLREYLDKRINKNVTIEELSNSIYRSKDYTIKLFKKEFNTTPYAYLTEKKLDAAGYMLLNSQSSIKQVAFNLGFEDQHYFSNVFKKKYKMSPKQYREKNKM